MTVVTFVVYGVNMEAGLAERKGRKAGYHHGDLRRALLDAALEQVREEGAAALSLREVARRAGVTHAAPYRHFASKEALVAAVAEEGFRTMRETLVGALDPAAGPGENLGRIGVAYVRFAVGHPSHFRVMYGTGQGDPASFPEMEEAGRGAFDVLVTTVEAGVRAGELRDEPIPSLSLAAWSIVHGLASLLVEGKLPPDTGRPEDLARVVTGMLIRGLAAEAEPKPRAKASARRTR